MYLLKVENDYATENGYELMQFQRAFKSQWKMKMNFLFFKWNHFSSQSVCNFLLFYSLGFVRKKLFWPSKG